MKVTITAEMQRKYATQINNPCGCPIWHSLNEAGYEDSLVHYHFICVNGTEYQTSEELFHWQEDFSNRWMNLKEEDFYRFDYKPIILDFQIPEYKVEIVTELEFSGVIIEE